MRIASGPIRPPPTDTTAFRARGPRRSVSLRIESTTWPAAGGVLFARPPARSARTPTTVARTPTTPTRPVSIAGKRDQPPRHPVVGARPGPAPLDHEARVRDDRWLADLELTPRLRRDVEARRPSQAHGAALREPQAPAGGERDRRDPLGEERGAMELDRLVPRHGRGGRAGARARPARRPGRWERPLGARSSPGRRGPRSPGRARDAARRGRRRRRRRGEGSRGPGDGRTPPGRA